MDTDPCTIWTCDSNETCVLDSTTDPNDDDACTEDTCDPTTAEPVNTPIDPVDDSDECTIDYCDSTIGLLNARLRPVFFESFADNSAGWTMEGPWEIGPAVKSGTPVTYDFKKIGDPEEDHSPTDDNGVAGVNIGGFADASSVIPLQYFESPTLDGTIPADESGARLYLRYWRWLVADYQPYMAHTVEVFDGTDWQLVFALSQPPTITDSSWKEIVHDITPYANAGMRVRFGHAILQGGVYPDAGSWSIDDLAVGWSRIELDDDDLCTETVCDPATGTITHTLLPAVEDDNDSCTEDTTCDPIRGHNHYDLTLVTVHDFSSPGSLPSPLTGEWMQGPAVASADDPGEDHTETSDGAVLGVNLGGSYDVNDSQEYTVDVSLGHLTTTMGNLTLEWWRWLNAGPSNQTPHSAQLLRNGVLIQTLFSTSTLATSDNKWVDETFNLTPIVTSQGNASFTLRFSYQVLGPSTTPRGGWTIDDIVVSSDACVP